VAKRVLPYENQQVGGTLGGPIVQNRTHFFSAYEGLFVNTADITSLPGSNPFASQENGTYPKKVRRRDFDARVDHRLNDKHNMYVRYAFDFYGDYAPTKPARSLDGGLPLGSADLNDSASRTARGEENWILSGNRSIRCVRTLIHRPYATPTTLGRRSHVRRSAGDNSSKVRRSFRAPRDADRRTADDEGEARSERRRRVDVGLLRVRCAP
jgi:hypothetical protein